MFDIDDTKIRRLDFALLLIFRELVRHRRTTVAAERLGLSQPAISHALSRLRDILGDPLFLRLPNGLQPTRVALALAPKIEAMIDLARQAVGHKSSFDPTRSERIFRIAANDFVASLLAPALADDMQHVAPGIRFAVSFLVGVSALDALRSDAVDLAVGRFSSLSDSYQSTVLGQESYLVVAREDHPALRDGLTLAIYLSLDHVLVSFKGDTRGTVDHALARLGKTRRVAASVPMFMTALTILSRSDMIGTVPSRLARRYASTFGLQLYEPPMAIEPFTTLAVRHARAGADVGLNWLSTRLAELWPPASL